MSKISKFREEFAKEFRLQMKQSSREESVTLGWGDPLDERVSAPKLRTQHDVREAIKDIDARRWRRIQRDYDWLERQMVKLNLNPEDARLVL